MKTPHKHAELIKAWADGAEIQLHITWNNTWQDYKVHEAPAWCPDYEYRIKPEPKPDVDFYGKASLAHFSVLPRIDGLGLLQGVLDNLKLTFDGETGKLKSAEVL